MIDRRKEIDPGLVRPKPGENVVAPAPKKGAMRKAVIILVIAAAIIGVIINYGY